MLWNVDLWREMDRMRRDMDSLFTNFNRASGATTYPLINVYENSDSIVVNAELPGMTKEQLNINFVDGAMTLSGKLERPASTKDMSIVRQERSHGAFEKTIRIPTKIDTDKISAAFSNGVLTVTLPKAEEAKPRTITVEAK